MLERQLSSKDNYLVMLVSQVEGDQSDKTQGSLVQKTSLNELLNELLKSVVTAKTLDNGNIWKTHKPFYLYRSGGCS